jgi:hypothetical protein
MIMTYQINDHDLPYQTAAKLVHTFRNGRALPPNMHHSECFRSAHTDVSVAIIDRCLDENRCWTVKDLAEHRGTSGPTVLKIL